MRVSAILSLFFAALLTSVAPALGPGPSTDPDEFFETRIRPVLANNCFSCHAEIRSGGLRVDSRDELLKGGKSGPAIVPGKAEESLVIQAVSYAHERLRMPPSGKLKDAEIAALKAWVKMGAPWPDSGRLPPKSKQYFITPEQKAFWAFQPCHKPSVPEVKDKTWPKSSIDNFILSRLEARGMKPVKAADKRVLIRRAYFDLIGLPPKPEEVDAFLQDTSSHAFAKVVDRLLASPHYGERWGRYWLDVARYAEDDVRGLQQESYQNAWRYRDWIIEAFNDDLPYTLFVKAQIAGDLLGERNKDKLVAGTGLFGLGPWYYDLVEPPQARADERHDRVDALTRGFLGLTVACARCHDHKYDPFSMQDYYALAGVFASSDYHEYPLAPDSAVAEYHKHQKKIEDMEAQIREFAQTQSDQLAHILAWKTSRYMVAAWKVLKGKSATEKVAGEEKLDQETLERWVKYLTNPQKEHPYLKAWSDLLARGATLEEVKKVADDFQATVLSMLAEKKEIDEENRVILALNKPAKDAAQVHLPNGFATYEDFCPGCNTAIRPMERNKFLLWRDLFTEEEHNEDPTRRDGGVLVYKDEKLDRFLSGEWKSYLDALRAQLEALKKSKPPEYAYLHALAESPKPGNLKLHLRGSPYNLGEEVPRRFIAVLIAGEPTPFKNGSGRLELAEGIASHPLTARVIVNRIWQHHFGYGIVRTASNFGRLGEPPTHPELLEYLTRRFIENNYSIKALHREIMLSATYQLSSDYSEKNSTEDPDNKLLWRASRRRLDAEALRDSLLYVTGNLDLTVGGPSAELTDDNKRRAVYGKVSRFKLNSLLELFDFPSASITSEQRNATNVPLQRLFFLNSDLVWQQAGLLADHLGAHGSADAETKIRKAYRLLFQREATETEVRLGLEFLREVQTESAGNQAAGSGGFKPPVTQGQPQAHSDGSPSAWQQYAQVLLSSNEFIFLN